MEAEIEAMQPGAEPCLGPPETGTGRNRISAGDWRKHFGCFQTHGCGRLLQQPQEGDPVSKGLQDGKSPLVSPALGPSSWG